jgi:hypothetical protein
LIATASALAAPAIITRAAANLRGSPPVAIPAAAAQWGYTKLVAFDPMTSLSTIDLNDTGASGFQWYLHNTWPQCAQISGWQNSPGPQSSSSFTLSSGQISLLGDNSWDAQQLSTIRTDGGSGYVGTAIQGGFYAEISYSFTKGSAGPPGIPGGSSWWPAFWAVTTEFVTGGSGPSVQHNIEFDAMEYYGSHLSGSFHDQTFQSGINTGDTNVVNDLSSVMAGSSGATGWNSYGMRLVTSNLNHGTGLADWFFNGVNTASTSYSAGGNYSLADTYHFFFMLNAYVASALQAKNFSLWQRP